MNELLTIKANNMKREFLNLNSHSRPPRVAKKKELQKIEAYMQAKGYGSPDEVLHPFTAVIPDYMSGSPGYCGKIYLVVYDGAPEFFYVFTEDKDGNLVDQIENNHIAHQFGYDLARETAQISAVMADHYLQPLYELLGQGYMEAMDTIARWSQDFESLTRNVNWEDALEHEGRLQDHPLHKLLPEAFTEPLCWDDAVVEYATYRMKLCGKQNGFSFTEADDIQRTRYFASGERFSHAYSQGGRYAALAEMAHNSGTIIEFHPRVNDVSEIFEKHTGNSAWCEIKGEDARWIKANYNNDPLDIEALAREGYAKYCMDKKLPFDIELEDLVLQFSKSHGNPGRSDEPKYVPDCSKQVEAIYYDLIEWEQAFELISNYES